MFDALITDPPYASGGWKPAEKNRTTCLLYTSGASLYVKEIGTDEHYLLSDEKYPVVFEYAGQDIATCLLYTSRCV